MVIELTYSTNEILLHWQSQSATSDEPPISQRYIHHWKRGVNVVNCVRGFKNNMTGVALYSLIGMSEFVKYEGSRPMNITWKLKRSIPEKY